MCLFQKCAGSLPQVVVVVAATGILLPSSNQFIVSHSHIQYQPYQRRIFFLFIYLVIFLNPIQGIDYINYII